MKTVANSLIGKATLVLSGVLVVCFVVLLFASSWMMRSAEFAQFNENARTLTEYFANQVNTGTRLKRGSMIEPTVKGALSNQGIDVVAIRLVNADGTEVLTSFSEGYDEGSLANAGAPDFEADTSTILAGAYLTVRAPVYLGAGADRTTVGEITAVWSKERSLATLQSKFFMSLVALAFTLALMVGVSVLVLRRLVARPLNDTISAMSDIAAEVDEVEMPARTSLEIGRVVDALETFQAGIQDRKRLEAQAIEQRALDARKAEESATAEKAQFEKEQAQQKAAREAAEEEARRSRQLMDDLNEVLGRAKAGDFSARMATVPSEDTQSNVRLLINDLMITVDSGVAATMGMINALAEGDLTSRMNGDFQGAFQALQDDSNKMSEKLDGAMSDVAACSHSLNENATELDSASKDLARRTEASAAGLAQSHAAVEAFSKTAKASAVSASEANTHVSEVRQQAQATDQIVASAVAAMEEISEASAQIAQVISVINDISFQTNLLALNAGVEAARAGEAGQGFAVVASEVRALAQRCADSANEIEVLISKSSEQVSSGVKLVGDVSDALETMSASILSVADLTNKISEGAQEQSSSAEEISTTLGAIDRDTQQNAAMNEEVVAVAASVAQTAKYMATLVQAFHLSDGSRRSEDMTPSQAA